MLYAQFYGSTYSNKLFTSGIQITSWWSYSALNKHNKKRGTVTLINHKKKQKYPNYKCSCEWNRDPKQIRDPTISEMKH